MTEFSWRNPHTFAKLDVASDQGGTEEWLLELNSISVLSRMGWTPDTVRVGDRIRVLGNLDRDKSKKFFFSNIFELADGREMVSSPTAAGVGFPPEPPADTTGRSFDG